MIDRPEGNRNRKPIPRQAVANLGKQRTFTNEFNYREMIDRQPIPFFPRNRHPPLPAELPQD